MVDLVNHYETIVSMKTVATNEAKTHLSAILQEVQQGEMFIIARGRQPIAKLVAYDDDKMKRPKVGVTMDEPRHVPEEAIAPLSPEEIRAWGL